MARLNPGRTVVDVTIEPVSGSDPDGVSYGDSVTVRATYQGGAKSGEAGGDVDVVVDQHLFIDPRQKAIADNGMTLEQLCSVGARVTLRGRSAIVDAATPVIGRRGLAYLDVHLGGA